MTYLVYNRDTNKVLNRYETHAAARGAITRARKRALLGNGRIGRVVVRSQAEVDRLAVAEQDHFYSKIDKMVTVRNAITGRESRLRQSELGGPCDPSTERYWSV